MAYASMTRIPSETAALHFDYGDDAFAAGIATVLSQGGAQARTLLARSLTEFDRQVHGGVEGWFEYAPLRGTVLVDPDNLRAAMAEARAAYAAAMAMLGEGEAPSERQEAACAQMVLIGGAQALLGIRPQRRGLTTRELAAAQGFQPADLLGLPASRQEH